MPNNTMDVVSWCIDNSVEGLSTPQESEPCLVYLVIAVYPNEGSESYGSGRAAILSRVSVRPLLSQF